MQRGKKNKKITSIKKLIFFLVMVKPHRSPSSKVSFVPCDHIVQRAHSCRRSYTLSIVSYLYKIISVNYPWQLVFIAPVILLPLHPVSLPHKNPQRRKIIHGIHPVGHKDQSITQSIWIRVYMYLYKYPVRVISMAVNMAVV